MTSQLVADIDDPLAMRFSKFLTFVFSVPAAAIFVAGLVACGANIDNSVSYAVTAQENYVRGEKKLEGEAWIGAAKYFGFLKARFPYSKYATLAELRLADAEFGAGNYLIAADSYKSFISAHPTHDMVKNGYAPFRIGEAFYRLLPDDFWMMPPSYERDQSSTHDAYRHLSQFINKYPKSIHVDKAILRVAKINERLASHEMYAAKFYWARNKPMATVLRLRTLLDKHKGSSHDESAMHLLGLAYNKVKMPDRAKEVWAELHKAFPKSKLGK